MLILCATAFFPASIAAQDRAESSDSGAARIAQMQTVAESSNWRATSTHAQVMDFCHRITELSPLVNMVEVGKTYEKRSLPILILADPPVAKPEDVGDRLVAFAWGGIHAGEVCGKPATLMLAREIASTPDHPLLEDLVVVFLPLLNADGNDRMSPDNRPGQLGPVEGMGTRRNARDLNINRDFVKLETEEGQAIAKVIREWQPAVAMDLHTTNGSQHRYVMTYDGQRHPASDPELMALTRERMLPEVGERLFLGTGYHSFWYGNFYNDHKEWVSYPGQPRYSTHFLGLHHTIGILAEAYSYAPYKDRVISTREFVRHCFEWVSDHKEEVRATIAAAKKRDVELGNNPGPNNLIALRHKLELSKKQHTVLGYAMGAGPKKEDKTPKDCLAVCNDKVVTTHSVTRPWAYIITSPSEALIENLRHHGIQMEILVDPDKYRAEYYTVESHSTSKRKYEGHFPAAVKVKNVGPGDFEWVDDATILIRTGQPLGSLAAFLLEPESEDGLTYWNYFDDGTDAFFMFPVMRVMEPQEWKTKPLEE